MEDCATPQEERACARIQGQHLLDNLQVIRQRVPEAKIMAVVKANAYGHGLLPIAQFLEAQQAAEMLCVALPSEGLALRRGGVSLPLLVLGAVFEADIPPLIENEIEVSINSLSLLDACEQAARRLEQRPRLHLKFDTGMGRTGFFPHELEGVLQKLKTLERVQIEGLYSHLVDSENTASRVVPEQIQAFQAIRAAFAAAGRLPPKVHLANSGGVLNFPQAAFDYVRPGIMLYGVHPATDESAPAIGLKPVMHLCARVTFVKRIAKGCAVSYGGTWRAPSDGMLATLPIGYGDGYPYRLSNRGEVLLKGKRYPIAGRVCMDQCMVFLGEDQVTVGEEAVLLGTMEDQAISAAEIATQTGTIPYEVLTNIGERILRVYA